METGDEDRLPRNATTELVTFAGIFGAAFSVAAFLLPAGDTSRKVVLAVLLAVLSALLWRGFVASGRHRLDPVFAVLTVASLGLLAWYSALAIGEGDDQLEALRTPAPTTTSTAVTSTSAGTTTATAPTTTEPTTTEPNATEPTGTADLPGFGFSAQPLYSSGADTIELGRFGLVFDSDNRWGSSDGWGDTSEGGRSDVVFQDFGMVGRHGTGFAVVGENEPKTFERCRDQAGWFTSLAWQQLGQGSFVCLRADSGRIGLLRVDKMPELGEERAYVTVSGMVWEP